MKIIAVNITKTLASGLSVQLSTEKEWKINLTKCSKYDYVIGVSRGKIEGLFKKINQNIILTKSNRVEFNLVELDATCIINCFNANTSIGLKGFVTKYIEINCNCQDMAV